jgi:hypothetical protein
LVDTFLCNFCFEANIFCVVLLVHKPASNDN